MGLTIKDLLDGGFHEYPIPRHDMLSDKCFCKMIKDDKGIKYGIHVRCYNNAQYGGNDGFDAILYCGEKEGLSLDIKINSVTELNVEQILTAFENIWLRLELDYHELYNLAEEKE